MMRVLLIGSGAREHALAWKLTQSPLLTALFIAPGNAGTAELGSNVALDAADHAAVVRFVADHGIDFVVIGPDAPVVAGLGDAVRDSGVACFAPSQAAAQIEGSKSFTKALCDAMDIPTAAYGRFDVLEPALAYLRQQGAPIVVKADGLAAGKGVTVAMTLAEAEAAVRDCFAGAFGAAGAAVVIEEFLQGEEASLFVLCDGTDTLVLGSAQDHKRAFDGDTGPNTGGMGAYSPAPVMTDAILAQCMERIIAPSVAGLSQRGTPYRGVLFAGLMITADGPKLIEYNARFGDPETQVLMLRLRSDLLPLLHAAATGSLAGLTAQLDERAALTVVLAARGYPAAAVKASAIDLPHNLDSPSLHVFHAGTTRVGGKLIAPAGRALSVCALGATVAEAQASAYRAVAQIDWPEGFCRTDIGWRAVGR